MIGKPLTKSKSMPVALAISDAMDMLAYARMGGDSLKIALCEAALNDLLDRYSCHTYQGSQTKETE